MRGVRILAAAALASAGVGGLLSGGAGRPRFVIGGNPRPDHVEGPGGRRERLATTRGRDIGRREDPLFGIKSRGRRGAVKRAALMAEAYAKTGRRDRDNPANSARITPA